MTSIKKLPKGISYRKDGRYMWRFSYNHQSYCGYAARLADAQKGLLDARYKVENGIYSKEKNYTLGEWFAIWHGTLKASLKESTRLKYQQMYSRHLSGSLGKMRLRKISPAQLQELLNRTSEKDLTRASIFALKSMLNDVFETARRHQIIQSNPMELVQMPACHRTIPRKTVFTKAELAEFLRRTEGSCYQNIYQLATLTGMRIGEILALQWQDIDIEQKTLTIRHTLSYNPQHGFYLESPKSATSSRVIPLLAEGVALFQRQKDAQNLQSAPGKGHTPQPGFEDLCFLTSTRKPIYASDVDKHMQKIIRQMRADGWLDPEKRYTFHSFRHTFATNCTEKGMPMKTLSTLLGHSSIRITMDIYTHITLDSERAELLKIYQQMQA